MALSLKKRAHYEAQHSANKIFRLSKTFVKQATYPFKAFFLT